MFEIVRTKMESDRVTDYVALGNLVNEKGSFHSAFIINYENKLFEFHYTSSNIEYIEISRDYFHKITDTIHSDEVPSFIALCNNIMKKANPKYGFFYSGESYNIDGTHMSNSGLGERMTCVGFCLNVLKGFHEDDYIIYTDWTEESIEGTEYLKDYCLRNNLNITEMKSYLRRITPLEFLTSGFFTKIPISKMEIDGKKMEVEKFLIENFKN